MIRSSIFHHQKIAYFFHSFNQKSNISLFIIKFKYFSAVISPSFFLFNIHTNLLSVSYLIASHTFTFWKPDNTVPLIQSLWNSSSGYLHTKIRPWFEFIYIPFYLWTQLFFILLMFNEYAAKQTLIDSFTVEL